MAKKSNNPWKRLSSKIVYTNKWYSVRHDQVIKPDGKPGEYNVVEAKDGVFILALDERERLQLIRKHRYATDINSLEVPAGGIEQGEKPLEAAKRELQEELGLTAQKWRQLGKFQAENAYINNFCIVFLATDLRKTGHDERLLEGIQKTEKLSLDEALQLVKAGEITDSQSMSALTLFMLDSWPLK